MNDIEKAIVNAARSYETTIRNNREAFANIMRVRDEQGNKGFDDNKRAFYALSKPCGQAADVLVNAICSVDYLEEQVIVDYILYWTDGKQLRRFPIREIYTLS